MLSPTQDTPLSSHQQSMQTNNIVFCWGGQRIFATTGDGKTRILSFPDFEPAYRFDYKEGPESEFMLSGHTSSCMTAELHPTNRYLATGGTDSLICLWDTVEWGCQRTITKMTGPVRSLSMPPGFPTPTEDGVANGELQAFPGMVYISLVEAMRVSFFSGLPLIK